MQSRSCANYVRGTTSAMKRTGRGRQQETAISHSCKRTKECGRAGGTSVSMNTSVALVIKCCLQVYVLGGKMSTCNQMLFTKWHLEHTLVPQELQNGALRVLLRSLWAPSVFNFGHFGYPRCSKWNHLGPLWLPKVVFWSLLGALLTRC